MWGMHVTVVILVAQTVTLLQLLRIISQVMFWHANKSDNYSPTNPRKGKRNINQREYW
jgi:hypothetical protein